jgi:DNA-binding PadR family transcriptional regulator
MVHSSPLEFALIGLLKHKAQSGYDLRKQFATTPIRHFSDSPGSVYPALRRLKKRKWLDATQSRAGRRRQVFRVTQTGEKAFRTWLHQGVTRDDVIWRLPELLMRFAFQGGNVSTKVSMKFLDQLEIELTSYARELRVYAKQAGLTTNSSTGALAFTNGVEGYESQLAWTRRTKKKLTEAL